MQALRRAPDIEEMSKSGDGQEWGEEVSPETLADADSKFVDIKGLRVRVFGCALYEVCRPNSHKKLCGPTGPQGEVPGCAEDDIAGYHI